MLGPAQDGEIAAMREGRCHWFDQHSDTKVVADVIEQQLPPTTFHTPCNLHPPMPICRIEPPQRLQPMQHASCDFPIRATTSHTDPGPILDHAMRHGPTLHLHAIYPSSWSGCASIS